MFFFLAEFTKTAVKVVVVTLLLICFGIIAFKWKSEAHNLFSDLEYKLFLTLLPIWGHYSI